MIEAMPHTDRRRGLRNPMQPLNLRVPKHQRAYLALRAELDGVAVSDVVRRLVDQAIDAEAPIDQDIGPGYDELEDGQAISMRQLVHLIEPDQSPELAARLRQEQDH